MAGREGEARRRLSSFKEKLEAARQELVEAQRKGDLARAGELAYGVIPELEKKLAGL